MYKKMELNKTFKSRVDKNPKTFIRQSPVDKKF